MTTKAITIDAEAYRRLKRVKQTGESFSQTTKRVVPPIDFNRWMASIEKEPLSDRAVAAVEALVGKWLRSDLSGDSARRAMKKCSMCSMHP